MTQDAQKQITHQAVVFYDGDCSLCNFCVRFIKQNDPNSFFSFAALESDLGKKLLPEKGLQSPKSDSVLLLINNQLFSESTAALKIASHLKWPWRALGIFLLLPKALRDPIYRWVANFRA